MKPTIIIALAAFIAAGTANADSRIERFCGPDHENEVASPWDVQPNPDGYYVVSLSEQVGDGDPRIILTNDPVFHLCTRTIATPEMSATEVHSLGGARMVDYLFVPISEWSARPSS
jgi:hypothetical protein